MQWRSRGSVVTKWAFCHSQSKFEKKRGHTFKERGIYQWTAVIKVMRPGRNLGFTYRAGWIAVSLTHHQGLCPEKWKISKASTKKQESWGEAVSVEKSVASRQCLIAGIFVGRRWNLEYHTQIQSRPMRILTYQPLQLGWTHTVHHASLIYNSKSEITSFMEATRQKLGEVSQLIEVSSNVGFSHGLC